MFSLIFHWNAFTEWCNCLHDWTTTTQVYSDSGALTVRKLFNRQILIFMFHYFNDSLPPELLGIFNVYDDITQRNTWSTDHIYIFLPRLESTHWNLSFQGPYLWNSLNPALRILDSLLSLKKYLVEMSEWTLAVTVVCSSITIEKFFLVVLLSSLVSPIPVLF